MICLYKQNKKHLFFIFIVPDGLSNYLVFNAKFNLDSL